jgi:hypothetical protein
MKNADSITKPMGKTDGCLFPKPHVGKFHAICFLADLAEFVLGYGLRCGGG